MPFGVHLFVYLADHALGINHESGSLPELHPLPFYLSEAERLHQAGIGVGEQLDGESELVAEALVRGNIVGAHANDFDPGSVEISLGRRKRFALDGAGGRVVFRIKVDNEPVSGKVGKLADLAVLVGKRKIRKWIARGKHRKFLSKVVV